jgi:cyclopropane-fatty-acyl-phospholipid synthase
VFDAIVSIEAIEAFARHGLPRAEKVRIYRALFERAHGWLAPSGRFGLQMIAYGSAGPAQFDRFIADAVFPESDLPFLSEVIEAAEGRFEVVSLHSARADYVLTLKCWLAALKRRRAAARALVGGATVQRFEDYLRLSWHMFASGACDLHRLILRRIDRARLCPSAETADTERR